jgi:heat shock protein HslJ
MSDVDIAVVFNEGLAPVMDETPAPPAWASLQFEMGSQPGRIGKAWMVAVAAALVVLVGLGSLLLVGRLGGTGGDTAGTSGAQAGDVAVSHSIEGRWVLESWEQDGKQVPVNVGVNAAGEVWLEFTSLEATTAGSTGSFHGSTGCNRIIDTDYDYSAGFLVHGRTVTTAMACKPDDAERALMAMMANNPDGIEVRMADETMTWYGKNAESTSYPLTFRRADSPDGSPPQPTPSEPSSTTTTAAVGDVTAMGVYEVGGVEVVTPTRLAQLPEHAQRVQFTTTVIDSGDGPELCLGIVLDSLPPQCSGPVASGLEMEGWTEKANGVRWGDQTVVVSWPPVAGMVDVLDQSDPVNLDIEFPPGDLPAECQGIEKAAGAGPINDYASSLGDMNGGLYVANDGTLVLQVIGDPAPHRTALAASGGACVVEVPRSEAEQLRIQNSLAPLLADISAVSGSYALSTGPGGRVDVQVPVADAATARAVAGIVDDPTAIRLVGMGVLLP